MSSRAADLVELKSNWVAIKAWRAGFYNDWWQADDALSPYDSYGVAFHTLEAIKALDGALGVIANWDYPFSNQYALIHFLDNHTTEGNGGGNGIAMSDILNAMLTASDDELKTFIGLVDAYRISLWNKPFDSQYYAALGRGFV